MDVREGGSYRWRWRSDEDGTEFGFYPWSRPCAPAAVPCSSDGIQSDPVEESVAVNPFMQFRSWLEEAQAASSLSHPRAFCLSTTDETGAPDARFVDLKDITEAGLTFGTHTRSAKGDAIARDPRVAATFWWDHIGKQIRVAGLARQLDDDTSDEMFRTRPRDAQLVSTISAQSRMLNDPEELERRLATVRSQYGDRVIERPRSWAGFCIEPVRMEFLTFDRSRLHRRQLYVREGDGWRTQWLQP